MDKSRPASPKQEPVTRPPTRPKWSLLKSVAVLGGVQLILLVVLLLHLARTAFPDFNSQYAALRSDLGDLKREPQLRRLEEKLDRTEASFAKLRQELQTIRPAGVNRQEGPLCPQLDVMVLALNSRNLTLADYKDAFRGLFADFARERPFWDPTGNYRLGFYVAQTEQVDGRVPFGDPTPRLTSFNIGAPGNHITERLSAIGPRVLEKFSKDHPNRRCLVVASAQCPPPQAADPGWKELPAVDAILIATAAQPLAADFTERWKSFCRHKKGEAVFLVSRADTATSDRAAVLELRLRLRSLAHPARIVRLFPDK